MELLRLPPLLRARVLNEVKILTSCRRQILTQAGIQRTYDDSTIPAEKSEGEGLLTLTPYTLNTYGISNAPNDAQLKYASHFFRSAPPNLLFSAAHFRSFPPSSHPEVAFLGRSNVGKSSLLNALFGRQKERVAYVSKKPGKTQTMNGFGVGGEGMGAAPQDPEARKEATWKRFGRGGVVVVDMPGYGGGSREEWGKEAIKYLEQRKQLRRTFLLVDVQHGLKSTDLALLTHMRKQGVNHTIILSKVDKILYDGASAPGSVRLSNRLTRLKTTREDIMRRISEEIGGVGNAVQDIFCCSAEKSLTATNGRRTLMGIDELRWEVLTACGLESDSAGQKRKLDLS